MFDWLKQKLGWATEAVASTAANVLPSEVKASPAAPEAPGVTMTGGRRKKTKRHGKRRHRTRRH